MSFGMLLSSPGRWDPGATGLQSSLIMFALQKEFNLEKNNYEEIIKMIVGFLFEKSPKMMPPLVYSGRKEIEYDRNI